MDATGEQGAFWVQVCLIAAVTFLTEHPLFFMKTMYRNYFGKKLKAEVDPHTADDDINANRTVQVIWFLLTLCIATTFGLFLRLTVLEGFVWESNTYFYLVHFILYGAFVLGWYIWPLLLVEYRPDYLPGEYEDKASGYYGALFFLWFDMAIYIGLVIHFYVHGFWSVYVSGTLSTYTFLALCVFYGLSSLILIGFTVFIAWRLGMTFGNYADERLRKAEEKWDKKRRQPRSFSESEGGYRSKSRSDNPPKAFVYSCSRR